MKYRELKNYKYQLSEDFKIRIGIYPTSKIIEPQKKDSFIELDTDGTLIIKKGYSWDGASGIAIDTKNFMRGSLVHDALYQLMRKKRINLDKRDHADRLLQEICIEDGMSSFRASNVYYAVKLFGESSAAPRDEKEVQEIILEVS